MKVISTNLAVEKTFTWQGRQVTTGIYKEPTNDGLHLGLEQVDGDCIANKKVHGGVDKACYLYGFNHYPFWQGKYPQLEWTYGMLGENLTIDQLEESELGIGDIYQLGTAVVQISRPRQPCFKFAHKIGQQSAIKVMLDNLLTGTYVRVLQQGGVKQGDELKLLEKQKTSVSIRQLTEVMFHFKAHQHQQLAATILDHPAISDSDKKYVRKNLGT